MVDTPKLCTTAGDSRVFSLDCFDKFSYSLKQSIDIAVNNVQGSY